MAHFSDDDAIESLVKGHEARDLLAHHARLAEIGNPGCTCMIMAGRMMMGEPRGDVIHLACKEVQDAYAAINRAGEVMTWWRGVRDA